MSSLAYLTKKNGSKHLIIFVHGFLGDEKSFINETGKHISFFFTQEIKDMCDIANFCYTSKIVDWKKLTYILTKIPFIKNIVIKKFNRPIEDYASILLTHYELLEYKYETINLICHSMGGIVAKIAILKILESRNEFKGFYITIASPHKGVEAAYLAKILRNKQAYSLTPLSKTINDIEDIWREKEKSLLCKYYSCLDDDIVGDESCYPRGSKEKAIKIEGTHTSCVKPTNKEAILVKHLNIIVSEFLHISTEINPARYHQDNTANPLFISYTQDSEPHYLHRNLDAKITENLKHSNLWITGPSGTGKTTASMRNALISGYELFYIDLSPCPELSAQSIFNEILATVATKISPNKPDEISAQTTHHAIKKICFLLDQNPTSKPKCILVDEFHSSSMDVIQELISNATALINSYTHIASSKKVKFVFTTPILTGCDNKILEDKFNELFTPIEIPLWTNDDIDKLIKLINKQINLPILLSDELRIINASNGSPRKLKIILSKLLHQSKNEPLSIDKAINDVSLEGIHQ